MPRRNDNTQATKIAPMMAVTQPPTMSERYCCRVTTTAAPTIGPKKVPVPPSSVIRITSPEVDCWTSESVTKPSTSAFSDPASPASAAERSEEHTSELQSRVDLVCRLLLEKK